MLASSVFAGLGAGMAAGAGITLGTLAASPGALAADFKELDQIAEKSLRHNIYPLKNGEFLAAGAHQFKSLWTRDFCFASRGLLKIGREDVVKRQLSLLLDHVRAEDGLVPRYMGSASHFLRRLTYVLHLPIPLRDPLDPEYGPGGGGEGMAIDSNALVILAALDYVDQTGDREFWNRYEDAILRAYRFYEPHLDPADGLVVQGEFADWQDSVNRSGKTFFVNLLYAVVTERLAGHARFGITQEAIQARRKAITAAFADSASGLYLSIAGDAKHVSLDGNLLAIDLGYHAPGSPEAERLYQGLRKHPLWTSRDLPGFNTVERYPPEWIGSMAKLVNVADYHDDMYWSWLMALSAKTAGRMGDLAERDRILAGIERLARRDGSIVEVFEPQGDHRPVNRLIGVSWLAKLGYRLYRAERPFSWGAGLVLDAIRDGACRGLLH